MQRRGAKNRPERLQVSSKTEKAEQAVEYPRRNCLFPIKGGFAGFRRMSGGRDRDRTCDPYHVNEAAEAKIAVQSVTYGRVHGRTSVDHSRNGSCATRKSRANLPTKAAWLGHYHPAVQRGDAPGPSAESVAIRGARHASA
jgi:hypothetical protein